MKKIVVFHTGRGGRFNNQGFVTCKGVVDEFSADYYGINVFFLEEKGIVVDESGNEMCTIEEYNSENGTLNIDGDYNTYNWVPFEELDEKQTKIMVRDLLPYNYKDLLIEDGFSEKLFEFLEANGKLLEFSDIIHSRITLDEFLKFSEVIEYVSEEEAENDGFFDTLEYDSVFYGIE